MKGDPVPDPDHILRYVGGTHVDQDDEGQPVIAGGAFIAKPKDDNCPSYNWLEILNGSLEERVQQVRDAARMKYGGTARLARLNVGQVRQFIRDEAEGHGVTVIQDPLAADANYPEPDLSHALMTNVPDENEPKGELIGQLIRRCIIDSFPAKLPKPKPA